MDPEEIQSLIEETENSLRELSLRVSNIENRSLNPDPNLSPEIALNLASFINANPPGAGVDTMTYASTIALNVQSASLHKTTTVNATGNATINASAGGSKGQVIYVLVENDATSGKTITFGTNFRPSATLVGTTSKGAVVAFVSDGTSFIEFARQTGL